MEKIKDDKNSKELSNMFNVKPIKAKKTFFEMACPLSAYNGKSWYEALLEMCGREVLEKKNESMIKTLINFEKLAILLRKDKRDASMQEFEKNRQWQEYLLKLRKVELMEKKADGEQGRNEPYVDVFERGFIGVEYNKEYVKPTG